MSIARKHNWKEFDRVLNENNIKYFYHFTDDLNIQSIKNLGGLYSWEYCTKNRISIPIPGGNDLSRRLDMRKNLQNYVRLSFVEEHPMLHAMRADGRIGKVAILKIDKEVALWETTMFSNGNATADFFDLYIGKEIDFLKSIKFSLFKYKYPNLDVSAQRYYQAEVLVREKIPKEFIKGGWYL